MAWKTNPEPPPVRRPSRRADDVLCTICHFALVNSGATPNQKQIAAELNVSQKRISYLMLLLERDSRITWITRYTYKVNDSVWDPPPDVKL